MAARTSKAKQAQSKASEEETKNQVSRRQQEHEYPGYAGCPRGPGPDASLGKRLVEQVTDYYVTARAGNRT